MRSEDYNRMSNYQLRGILPDLVREYLDHLGVERTWITVSEVSEHYHLGRRGMRMLSSVLKKLNKYGIIKCGPRKEKPAWERPEIIRDVPIFVRDIKRRLSNSTYKYIDFYLVEKNPHYVREE